MFLGAICKLIVILGYACSQGDSGKIDAQSIFLTNCERCHGTDGKKGNNGAFDLTMSEKDLAARVEQITNGSGRMKPFRKILTPEEITAVAQYTIDTFKD